jgi:hypothetical protein
MRRNLGTWWLALGLLLVGALGARAADEVFLQDGTRLRGEILKQSTERLRMRTDEGAVVVLEMRDVRKIVREAGVAPPLVERGTLSPRKEPHTAFHMSCFLPGAGQFYNEEAGKGLLQLGLFIGGLAVAISEAPEEGWVEVYSPGGLYLGTELRSEGDESACVAGLLVAGGAWLWSVLDAPGGAERWNRRHGLALYEDPLGHQTLAVEPVLFGGKTQDSSGVQVAYRF